MHSSKITFVLPTSIVLRFICSFMIGLWHFYEAPFEEGRQMNNIRRDGQVYESLECPDQFSAVDMGLYKTVHRLRYN